MARRLDKIEKDLGYFDMRAEKSRRLRKKLGSLQVDLELFAQLEAECASAAEGVVGRGGPGEDGGHAFRRAFFSAAMGDRIGEEKALMSHELETLGQRLQALGAGEPPADLRSALQNEKGKVLKRLSPRHSSQLRRMGEDIKKVDDEWNSLGEDLLNLDEGLFFLERNLDYLRSCRVHLIEARNGLDLEAWGSRERLKNLFRHSVLGRAVEMATGADRALRSAQKELVCISGSKPPTEAFRRVLLPILGALFVDLYSERGIRESVRRVEEVQETNQALVEAVRKLRAELGDRYQAMERSRNRIYSKMGAAGRAIQR